MSILHGETDIDLSLAIDVAHILFVFMHRKDNFTFKCHRSNGTGTASIQDIFAVSLLLLVVISYLLCAMFYNCYSTSVHWL